MDEVDYFAAKYSYNSSNIKTIYLKGNAHSRFKPYKDSVNIIIEIIKYRIKTLILSS